MVTLNDVATRAGVSVSTVSRVLTNAIGARVSDGARQRILDAARELNYRPNFAARALKSALTNVVAFIVPDLTNALFTELMGGVEHEARAQGHMVLLSRAEGMPELEESLLQLLGEGRVDGAVVQADDYTRPETLRTLASGKFPVVFVNSVHPGHAGSVILDDARGIRLGTQHLIDLGHERIAFINGPPPSGSANRRAEGFFEVMNNNQLDVPEGYVTRLGYFAHQGRAALARIMALDEVPTGVVVANVNAGLGVLLEARRLGLRIPQDLSVIAMHDAWTAESTWPPLTTIHMPLYELGRVAVRAVVERITTGSAADLVVRDPAPKLVIRESTAAPRR